jgi:hypothetical protein
MLVFCSFLFVVFTLFLLKRQAGATCIKTHNSNEIGALIMMVLTQGIVLAVYFSIGIDIPPRQEPDLQ